MWGVRRPTGNRERSSMAEMRSLPVLLLLLVPPPPPLLKKVATPISPSWYCWLCSLLLTAASSTHPSAPPTVVLTLLRPSPIPRCPLPSASVMEESGRRGARPFARGLRDRGHLQALQPHTSPARLQLQAKAPHRQGGRHRREGRRGA